MTLLPSSDRAGITKTFSFSPGREHSEETLNPASPALTFRMNTEESQNTGGGYDVSVGRERIDQLRRILDESGLTGVSVEDTCSTILSKASRSGKAGPKLTRSSFNAAMKSITSWSPEATTESKRALSKILDGLFAAFDPGNGKPNALQVAVGMTVLSHGKKSAKLEFAFDVLEKNKRKSGSLSQSDVVMYLESFLTVLLGVALSPGLSHDADSSLSTLNGNSFDVSADSIRRAATAGAEYAASVAFEHKEASKSMDFDCFADWYTQVGYTSIPWLELIDIGKWLAVSK